MIDNAQKYGKKYQVEIDEDFAITKLYEEVGECAQALLIHNRKCRPEKFLSESESKQSLAEELADIIGITIVNAHLHGVDLEAALRDKWMARSV